MARRSQILFAWLPFLVDAALAGLSLRLSYWLRFESGFFAAPKGIPPLEVHLPAFGFMLLVLLLSFHAFGLYRVRSGRLLAGELVLTLKAVTVGAVVGMAATFLYREVSFSRLLLFQAWLVSAVLLILGRLAVRRVIDSARRAGWGATRVALVGWGSTAARLGRAVRERASFGYHLVGWVGPEPGVLAPGVLAHGAEGAAAATYLGDIGDLREISRRLELEGILVALPAEAHGRMTDIIRQVDGEGIDVKFVPDFVDLASRSATVSEVAGIPLIGVREFPLRPVDRVVKRTMDVVLSAVGLIVLIPLLSGIALLIRTGSPGPVIYRQPRVGRDGRTFVMYKFRSMREDAEEKSGPTWAKDGDARATGVGRHLRKLSLDELPQLLNVLRGEMSLVGPRPEREFFVRQFETAVHRYLDRHRVKSGMTGWAQVHGLRGNTSVEERTEYDVFYAENWSVALDLRILWLTVLHLLSGGRLRGPGITNPLPHWNSRGRVHAEDPESEIRNVETPSRGGTL